MRLFLKINLWSSQWGLIQNQVEDWSPNPISHINKQKKWKWCCLYFSGHYFSDLVSSLKLQLLWFLVIGAVIEDMLFVTRNNRPLSPNLGECWALYASVALHECWQEYGKHCWVLQIPNWMFWNFIGLLLSLHIYVRINTFSLPKGIYANHKILICLF